MNRASLNDVLQASLMRSSRVEAVAEAVFATIQAFVPFGFACLATTDPLTGVITWPYKSHPLGIGDEEFTATEYGEPDVNQFADIAQRPTPIGVLSIDTGGHPERCRRFRDFLSPQFGFTDELRLVVRTRQLTWAALALYRGSGDEPFSARDAEQLAGATPAMSDAIRRTLFTDEAVAYDAVPEPAVIVVDRNGRPRQMTRAARERITDLGGWDNGSLPASLLAISAKARATSGVLVSRTRLPSGQWLTLRASVLEEPDGDTPGTPDGRSVVVTVDLARPAELTGLTLTGRGLTAREQDIVNLVVKGASTKAIASSLHLSPHTVQDHLKAIFAKLGVNSRRQLIGQLYS